MFRRREPKLLKDPRDNPRYQRQKQNLQADVARRKQVEAEKARLAKQKKDAKEAEKKRKAGERQARKERGNANLAARKARKGKGK